MPKDTTVEAEVIRLRQSIATQMRRLRGVLANGEKLSPIRVREGKAKPEPLAATVSISRSKSWAEDDS